MSGISEMYGGLGDTFQTRPRDKGIYATGVHKFGTTLLPTTVWTVVTNGDIKFGSPLEAKSNQFMASAELPQIVLPMEGDLRNFRYRRACALFLLMPDEKYESKWQDEKQDWHTETITFDQVPEKDNLAKLLKFRTGKTGLEGTEFKSEDLLVKTWPYYDGNGFIQFDDNTFTHILTTQYEFEVIMDSIQEWITNVETGDKPPVTRWETIGYGLYEPGQAPKLVRRPGMRCSWAPQFEGNFEFDSKRNDVRGQAYYSFRLELLARILSKVYEYSGELAVYEDYLASAWLLIWENVGTGVNSPPARDEDWPINAAALYKQIM